MESQPTATSVYLLSAEGSHSSLTRQPRHPPGRGGPSAQAAGCRRLGGAPLPHVPGGRTPDPHAQGTTRSHGRCLSLKVRRFHSAFFPQENPLRMPSGTKGRLTPNPTRGGGRGRNTPVLSLRDGGPCARKPLRKNLYKHFMSFLKDTFDSFPARDKDTVQMISLHILVKKSS